MPRALALFVVAALALVCVAPAAARERPVTRGSTYLALGDSVSFGYQEPQVKPAPDYDRASSFRGWPEHAARALHLKLTNAACPGETSASLIKSSRPNFGCTNLPGANTGYRKLHPLHVKYKGSQLSFAVRFLRKHRGARLVTLMIGANDLFRCQATTKDACTGKAERGAVIKSIRTNVRTIVRTLRKKAKYRGRIVLMRYFAIDYRSAFLVGVIRTLNTAVYRAAKPYRVQVADGFGEWRAAAHHSGDDSCTAGLLTQLGEPGKCGVHPSWAGQALLAQALERVITR